MKLVKPHKIEGIVCDLVKPKEANEIVKITGPKLIKLCRKLSTKEITCMGLCAPQVGINKKWFVKLVAMPDKSIAYVIYFNAWYTQYAMSSRTINVEGCYSYNLGNDPGESKKGGKKIVLHFVCLGWSKINTFCFCTKRIRLSCFSA